MIEHYPNNALRTGCLRADLLNEKPSAAKHAKVAKGEEKRLHLPSLACLACLAAQSIL
jgi:hypothetical protein